MPASIRQPAPAGWIEPFLRVYSGLGSIRQPTPASRSSVSVPALAAVTLPTRTCRIDPILRVERHRVPTRNLKPPASVRPFPARGLLPCSTARLTPRCERDRSSQRLGATASVRAQSARGHFQRTFQRTQITYAIGPWVLDTPARAVSIPFAPAVRFAPDESVPRGSQAVRRTLVPQLTSSVPRSRRRQTRATRVRPQWHTGRQLSVSTPTRVVSTPFAPTVSDAPSESVPRGSQAVSTPRPASAIGWHRLTAIPPAGHQRPGQPAPRLKPYVSQRTQGHSHD